MNVYEMVLLFYNEGGSEHIEDHRVMVEAGNPDDALEFANEVAEVYKDDFGYDYAEVNFAGEEVL